MKNIFAILFLFFTQSVFAQYAYIKIGDAQAKKSNLAFPVMNQMNATKTGNHVKLAAQIHNTAMKDLELSTYFNIMAAEAFLEDTTTTSIKSKSMDANGFKFDTWKTIGAEFLIRSSFSLIGDDISVEMYLYHVNESKAIVGKKYSAKSGNTSQIGHTLANDILEALTGRRGVFLSKITASTNRTGHKEIITMNWDGSDQQIITNDKNIAIAPNWSPDGKKLLYSVYTRRVGSAQQNLTMYEHNLGSGKRVIISNRNGLNQGGSYSPDGKYIYLTISQGGSPDLYKLNLAGDIVTRLTKGPSGAMNVEAAISADGSKLAFSSDRGGNPSIYTMNSDGSNVKRVTFQGKYNSTPTWSPDGKKIAFASQIESYFDIFVMDSDGSNLRRITTATKPNGKRASNEDPSFSPDGRFVVFTSNRTGNYQIFVTSVDGNEERRVTQDGHNYFKPKWSKNLE